MSIETWKHDYRVAASPEVVYDYLKEPTNYLKLSPLIVDVSDIQHRQNDAGQPECRYRSIERFKFGGIFHYDNRLDVTMTLSPSKTRIIADVQSQFSVTVRFIYDLAPSEGQTQVTETITVQMPGFVRTFVVQQAKMVQQYRAQMLNSQLSAAASRA